ncbi:MAG: glutathione synthase [Gammaproteobacteria bacterium]|nr:glutathione synthase [Gammaproteobacteria bacterium]OUU06464.1 MAG: glutathione synthase [Gammaproteobacteria bacterium TMED34]
MTVRIGVVMDPIATINPKKDSTLAMMLAATRRDWSVFVITLDGLHVADGKLKLRGCEIRIDTSMTDWSHAPAWYELGPEEICTPNEFNALLMRKDPPFNMEYIYATYLLEMAEAAGTPVLNKPGSIRDANEKIFALRFPQCCPPHLVSRDPGLLRAFHTEHEDVIYKPLDGMGGMSIFRAAPGDSNLSVIIETLTDGGQRQIMAQRYIPEIVDGDTRILLIDGEPVSYGLARIPLAGESRGNLAAGGTGVTRRLNERDHWICQQIGPTLKERGLYFVGIDVIGDYLTEINVTCPTCIREIDAQKDLDIAGDYLDFITETLL